jgi:hypothetical protein
MTTVTTASIKLQLEQLSYSIRTSELVARLQKHYQKPTITTTQILLTGSVNILSSQ